jgi:hypothetical protein
MTTWLLWLAVAIVAFEAAIVLGFYLWVRRPISDLAICIVCRKLRPVCCSDEGSGFYAALYPRCFACCDHTHSPDERKK